MAPAYRSLLPGGFYSSNPYDRSQRASVRTNNPGALNTVGWVRNYPGYLDEDVTSHSGASANNTAIFETPEHGIAAWVQLILNYRKRGLIRVREIIDAYGGGQDYSNYLATIIGWSGLPASAEISPSNEHNMLAFAKAMFRYESGLKDLPWSNEQILLGIRLGRVGGRLQDLNSPVAPPTPKEPVVISVDKSHWLVKLFRLLFGIFRR